jgi:RNA polymerase sigma-70 factor (ECF subfamily)
LSSDGILTDAEIMLKIAGYDSSALELLYDRYAPMLYALIKKIIPNQELADKVLSEVFVITLKQIDPFDFKSSDVYTWMVTLTRNKAIDSMKRQQGKEKRAYTEEFEKDEIIPKLSPEIKAMEFADVTRRRNYIQTAINSLTDAQKSLLDLSYYEGWMRA